MQFIDRLQSEANPTPEEVAQAPWRWLIDLGAEVTEVSVSGRPLTAAVRSLSLLLGLDQPHFRWRDRGVHRDVKLRIGSAGKACVLPPAVELRRLRMTGYDPSSAEEIIYPLQSPPDEQANYQELITLIENNAMPIAGICSRPRLNLRVEERAEALRRARRMTLRTAPYLARHAEDWEGQSLRMPYPQRLLTALPEDEWATYENRLVRTVVRDGYGELVSREREVRAMLHQLRQALQVSENELGNLHREDWPRTNRIYELLRGNVSVDALKQHIDKLEEQAERLRHAIGILGSARSSPLFRMLGAVRDERELRPTNLLLHDTSYHAALVLRQQLNRFMQAQNDQPAEDPLPLYFQWLELALRRALMQTGFAQERPDLWIGHDWQVAVKSATETWRIELRFQRTGSSAKAAEQSRLAASRQLPAGRQGKASPTLGAQQPELTGVLCLFPLWLDLAVETERKRLLGEITSADPDRRYLILFPSDQVEAATEQYRHGGLFPDTAISASPGRLDSVEILARELIRETWLRDLLARQWPQWCLACQNTHLDCGDGNKFVCDTCYSESAITQETCAKCQREFTTPYLNLFTARSVGVTVSRSSILPDELQLVCTECRLLGGAS